MLSIAELIDKLVIENIKIFRLRESLHSESLSDEEYVNVENKMNLLNENRGIISDFLDDKIHNVVVNGEKNRYLRNIKTYSRRSDEDG
tara:strand:+ start:295 stop:558 length:264 start_codon:yes stop_codon:yes gene_type:complete